MNLIFKRHVFLMLIVASNTSFAADKITSKETQSKASDSAVIQTEQKHLMWGLSIAEYARYEELMKGIRGSISPETISPIEVLGIHAQNEAERQKYARLWADMMEKDTERVLAFQRAYDQAWKDKGNRPLIEISQLKSQSPSITPTAATHSSGLPVTKMIVATKLDGCAACDKKIQQLLTSMLVDKTLHLDVYFSDSSDKPNSVIRQWAISNRVDAEMLKSRRLTLNHGQSLMNQYQLDEKQLPATFKVDNNGGVKRVE